MTAVATHSQETLLARNELLCGRARLDEKFAPLAKIWPNEGANLTVEQRSFRLFQKAQELFMPDLKINVGQNSLEPLDLIDY